jgi:hypothetical protein
MRLQEKYKSSLYTGRVYVLLCYREKDGKKHQPVFFYVIMRDFAASFYKSKKWQSTEKAYKKSVGGLCERCLERGRITVGELVHHKIHITPQNISDPSVTLSWSNLQLLCRTCHGEVHKHSPARRYLCDGQGRVEIL